MYNETSRKASVKYIRNEQKRISVNWLKTDYEKNIGPFVNKSGMSLASFVKEAVREKVERETAM